jgi:hypothetical protein
MGKHVTFLRDKHVYLSSESKENMCRLATDGTAQKLSMARFELRTNS